MSSKCTCRPERISVIIPTHNYGDYINQTLKSVFDQNVSDIEVIVVDDGSTDGTFDSIYPYQDDIKYIYQENSGSSAARNRGILDSTGEYIVFLDSDDMLQGDTFFSQRSFLQEHPDVDISVCRSYFFFETDEREDPIPTGQWRLYKRDLDVHLCHFNIAPPHAFMCRRRVIAETGWFDVRLHACADHDYWIRAASKGFVPLSNSGSAGYYRRHPHSMSQNKKNQHIHDAYLHLRVSALLDHYLHFPKARRLEGILANIAGSLLTASRLMNIRERLARDLLENAGHQLALARFLTKKKWTTMGFLREIYYARVFECLDLLWRRKKSFCDRMYCILSDMIPQDEYDTLRKLDADQSRRNMSNLEQEVYWTE